MNLIKLFRTYRPRMLLTLALILLEAGILILFPLFIGFAIDGLLSGNHLGVLQLGLLGLGLLIVGVGRRVMDSRFYGKIFQDLGTRTISQMKDQQASVKTARLSMVQELVEFLENSLPELINNIIGLVGVVIILATLSIKVFLGSLVVTLIVFLIYMLSSRRTTLLNERSNDEVERQVDILATNDNDLLQHHLKELTKWNIKLSDLEAVNFSASWLIALVFLVTSIIFSASDGIVQYGSLFALVMYVFQYIENVISLPFFYQSWLRLQEIMSRLKATAT